MPLGLLRRVRLFAWLLPRRRGGHRRVRGGVQAPGTAPGVRAARTGTRPGSRAARPGTAAGHAAHTPAAPSGRAAAVAAGRPGGAW